MATQRRIASLSPPMPTSRFVLPADVKTPLLQGFDAVYWNMR